jgi:hypothetical protein
MPGVYVCGGVIRSFYDETKVSDIDLYFMDSDVRDLVNSLLASSKNHPYKHKIDTVNASTFECPEYPPIQLCRRHGSLKEVVKGFDFTICKFGIESLSTFMRGTRTMEDITEKRLIYTGGMSALGSLHRAFKYANKGYKMRRGVLMDLLREIGDVDDLDEEYINTHLGGGVNIESGSY